MEEFEEEEGRCEWVDGGEAVEQGSYAAEDRVGGFGLVGGGFVSVFSLCRRIRERTSILGRLVASADTRTISIPINRIHHLQPHALPNANPISYPTVPSSYARFNQGYARRKTRARKRVRR